MIRLIPKVMFGFGQSGHIQRKKKIKDRRIKNTRQKKTILA